LPHVEIGPITKEVVGPFDVLERADHLAGFTPWERPTIDGQWSIGLIVGASGSGKSLLLREFATPTTPSWDESQPIAEHFDPADAAARFSAVGLNDVPTWIRPYQVLSTGQKFRADLARVIGDHAVVDEFTSVVSRPVAQSACAALRRWATANKVTGMVFASCHHDVERWLEPDWIIDTDEGVFRRGVSTRRRWRRLVTPLPDVFHD
jgi:ABC-type ATPase with predicted acetyltransferase domain